MSRASFASIDDDGGQHRLDLLSVETRQEETDLLIRALQTRIVEADARALLNKCMQVLFYRDTRASSKISIGKVDASGASVADPVAIETYWEHPEFVRGGGFLGDGSW